MCRVLFGAALGLLVGYSIRKMQEEKKFDKFSDDLNRFADQAKKKVKNFVDVGQNEAEYVVDRAEYAVNKGKEKVSEVKSDVANKTGNQDKK